MPIWNIQVWKSTKSNNSKSMMPRVMVLVHCTSTPRDLSAYEISSWIRFELCFGQNSRMKMNKEQWLQKNEILSYGSCVLHFSSMRFIYLWSFMLTPCKVMPRTKKGTDGRTDRQTDGLTDRRTEESITICHPSGA